MQPGSFLFFGFGSICVLTIGLSLTYAQYEPCTTPVGKPGLCVSIKKCQNIYHLEQSPEEQTTGIANYIKKSACTISGVSRSVCCLPTEVVQEILPEDCGPNVFDRVSHGNVSRLFAYPWMAIIRYKTKQDIIDGCGGSLINKRYVLTAAHCIRTRSERNLYSVVLGEHTKGQEKDCDDFRNKEGELIDQDCADPIEEYFIETSVPHEDYNSPNRYNNDIGLIRLDRDVTMKDHIKPICLPDTPDLKNQQLANFILAGWGATENASWSDVLMAASMPLVDNETCQQQLRARRLRIQLGQKQMCAGGENKVDACHGDSGGPLVAHASTPLGSRFVQYGVVTAGVGSCGQISIPGVYSRVANYMDWILAKMQ